MGSNVACSVSSIGIGYRARIKSERWEDLINHEVILTARSGKNFHGIVLKKGINIPLIKGTGTVIDEIAWLHPDEIEFVDDNIKANMGFVDWYKKNEDSFCGDCGNFCGEDAASCPKCGCEWG